MNLLCVTLNNILVTYGELQVLYCIVTFRAMITHTSSAHKAHLSYANAAERPNACLWLSVC